MYALVGFWAVFSWLHLWRALGHERCRDWMLFALATLGGLSTHYSYLALLIAQMIVVGFVAYRRGLSRRPGLYAAAAVAVALMLGAPIFDEVLQGPVGPRRGFEAMVFPYTGFAFVAGFGIGPSLAELHRGLPWQAVLAHWPEITAVGVVGLCLAVAGLRAIRSGGESNLCLVAWAFIPPLTVFAVSAATGVAYNVRYSIAALPAFALLSARGLLSLPTRARAPLSLALVAIAALSIVRMRTHPDYVREDLRAAGVFLESATSDGDRVVVSARYLVPLLGHYYPNRRPVDPLPRANLAAVEGAQRLLHKLATGPGSVWLVLSREWDDDPQGFLRAALKVRQIQPAYNRNGVTIFVIRSSGPVLQADN
jgi:hypothetical protein